MIQIVDGGGLRLNAYSAGDVYLLLSAATWGVYTVFGKRLNRKLGSSVFTTWTMLLGTAFIVGSAVIWTFVNKQLTRFMV